jgi:hypothetical protein
MQSSCNGILLVESTATCAACVRHHQASSGIIRHHQEPSGMLQLLRIWTLTNAALGSTASSSSAQMPPLRHPPLALALALDRFRGTKVARCPEAGAPGCLFRNATGRRSITHHRLARQRITMYLLVLDDPAHARHALVSCCWARVVWMARRHAASCTCCARHMH